MHLTTVKYFVVFALGAVLVMNTTPIAAEELAEVERQVAENPTNVPMVVAAGRLHMARARQGDEASLRKAEEYLDRALSLAPEDPQILVLHGSMLALKGREATLPVMKMRYVESGLKEMDRAVELVPMDFGIRYQRGAYCLNLPDIFERAQTAVEDFEHLLMMARQAPDEVSREETASIRLSLARAKLKVGEVEDARALLEALNADTEVGSYSDEARELLQQIDR